MLFYIFNGKCQIIWQELIILIQLVYKYIIYLGHSANWKTWKMFSMTKHKGCAFVEWDSYMWNMDVVGPSTLTSILLALLSIDASSDWSGWSSDLCPVDKLQIHHMPSSVDSMKSIFIVFIFSLRSCSMPVVSQIYSLWKSCSSCWLPMTKLQRKVSRYCYLCLRKLCK